MGAKVSQIKVKTKIKVTWKDLKRKTQLQELL